MEKKVTEIAQLFLNSLAQTGCRPRHVAKIFNLKHQQPEQQLPELENRIFSVLASINRNELPLHRRSLTSKMARGKLWQKLLGRCGLCGNALTAEFHADHMVPFKHKPQTNPNELQPTCKRCNQKKGANLNYER